MGTCQEDPGASLKGLLLANLGHLSIKISNNSNGLQTVKWNKNLQAKPVWKNEWMNEYK